MQVTTGGSQMIARVKQACQRGCVARDDGIGTSETAEKVRAQLAGAGAGRDPGERIFAVEAKHRYRCASEWLQSLGAGRQADRGCLFEMADERTLQRRHANEILERDFSAFNVADSR